MASKTLLMIFAVTMAIVLTTSATLEDLTGDEIDALIEAMVEKRDQNAADVGFEDDLFQPEMEKRGPICP